MTFSQGAFLAAASAGAGVINAIAGGGSLLTFPALLTVLPPGPAAAVAANATNTLALWAGQLSSAFAYKKHLAEERQRFDPAGHYHRPDVLGLTVTLPDSLGGSTLI